jgi:uncharacterized protein YgbK (DUF1537 family)/catechol 2,3-dioxygenase-like lactoylglutathione lyase family enzyme
MLLAVVADDLTGALDTGVQFREVGFTTQVLVAAGLEALPAVTADVLVLDTETRGAEPAEAAAAVAAWGRRLRSAGAGRFYKKIDSTLRGPWVEELVALRAAVGGPEAVVCPAYPAQGRRVRGGRVWLADRCVGDLRAEIDRRAGRDRDRITVADAETDADLDALAGRASGAPLLCGSAGLAAAWARRLAVELGHGPGPDPVPPLGCRRVLVVAGSRSEVTRAQVAMCREQAEVRVVAAPSSEAEAEAEEDPAVAEALARDAARHHAGSPFDALVLAGGETAYRVLRALGVSCLELSAELLPGIPLATAQEGRLRVVTKAGGFGAPDALARILERLVETSMPGAPALLRIHHAQITIPSGAEDDARRFYCEVLGLREVPKPESLDGRGGFWLEVGEAQVHVGTEDGVNRLVTKAHLGYEVADLDAWRARLEQHGTALLEGVPIPGYDRFECRDPFGNRLELIQKL